LGDRKGERTLRERYIGPFVSKRGSKSMLAPFNSRHLVTLCLIAALAALPSAGWADEVDGEEVAVPASAPAAEEPREDASSKDEDGWEFEIAPYMWFIFMEGSTSFRDQDQDVSIGFGEVWEQLHFSFMLDAEVKKGKFGVLTDLVYAYLWNRQQQGPQTFESDIHLVIFDFGAYYEALSMDLGSGPKAPRLRLQPFFGGRYVYLDVPTTILPAGRFRHPTSNTVAPILGLRAFLDINDHWNMSFHGDGGGWGVDDLDLTWQAELLAGYRWHFSRLDFNLLVGYKGLGWQAINELSTDFVIHGPVLKLGFEF
jgi:hypothetical protein